MWPSLANGTIDVSTHLSSILMQREVYGVSLRLVKRRLGTDYELSLERGPVDRLG